MATSFKPQCDQPITNRPTSPMPPLSLRITSVVSLSSVGGVNNGLQDFMDLPKVYNKDVGLLSFSSDPRKLFRFAHPWKKSKKENVEVAENKRLKMSSESRCKEQALKDLYNDEFYANMKREVGEDVSYLFTEGIVKTEKYTEEESNIQIKKELNCFGI